MVLNMLAYPSARQPTTQPASQSVKRLPFWVTVQRALVLPNAGPSVQGKLQALPSVPTYHNGLMSHITHMSQ